MGRGNIASKYARFHSTATSEAYDKGYDAIEWNKQPGFRTVAEALEHHRKTVEEEERQRPLPDPEDSPPLQSTPPGSGLERGDLVEEKEDGTA
jgi:hypothetical protein